MSEFSKAVEIAIADESISRKELADRLNVHPTYVTRILEGKIPSDDLCKKLLIVWEKEKASGLRILKGHLIDEIIRFGSSPDVIEPVIKGDSPAPKLDEDLELLKKFLHNEPSLRGVIHKLADTARLSMDPAPRRHYPKHEPRALKVAEEPQTGGYKHPLLGPPPPREIRNKELDKRTLISGELEEAAIKTKRELDAIEAEMEARKKADKKRI